MGLFKSKEEKARETEEARLDEHLAKVRFFPSSQAEYETLVGYPVRVIDSKRRNIGIRFNSQDRGPYECRADFELKKYLVTEGIEALIGCNIGINQFVSFDVHVYGLPVAKK